MSADRFDKSELRDLFAMVGLNGLLSNPNFQWDLTSDHTPEENAARRAYSLADAMLAQREARP